MTKRNQLTALAWFFGTTAAVMMWTAWLTSCTTAPTVEEVLERMPQPFMNPSALRTQQDEVDEFVRARNQLVRFCEAEREKGNLCDPDS